MKTLSTFKSEYPGMTFWTCDAGQNDNGASMLDVLVYNSVADMAADDDNSLAIARATVLDDSMFGRINEDGNVDVFNADGSAATRLDSRVWPVGSDLSGAYEHPAGITITREDAEKIQLTLED
jgi:hypothetical protein